MHSDPAAFSPDACATGTAFSRTEQTNLRDLKTAMAAHNVTVAHALTPHDCTSVALAGALFGKAQPWSILDYSPSDTTDIRAQKIVGLRQAISRWHATDNLSLVSQPPHLREAIGELISFGEILVIAPLGEEGYRVLGRLQPD
jgi:hypothetical protein